MEIKLLSRDALKKFESYTMGGKKPVALKAGISEIIKLNANENQLGMSPLAIEAMQKEVMNGYLYRGDLMGKLKTKIADRFKLDVSQIVLTSGSSGIIHALGDAFLNPGDEVVMCVPSYPAYYPMVKRFEATMIEVPLKNQTYDLEAMLKAITPKTKLAVIVNPNNPTGSIVRNEDFDRFMECVPDHVIVVVDEAYMEWVNEPSYKDALNYVRENMQIIVLRTFSKIYGMAGARVGYAITTKEISAHLALLEGTYGSNRVGIAGAYACMDDKDYLERSLQNNTSGRIYLMEELEKCGYEVIPSYTSFVYFKPHCPAEEFVLELESYGILIRAFGSVYTRVSVGLPYQNERFIDAVKSITKMS